MGAQRRHWTNENVRCVIPRTAGVEYPSVPGLPTFFDSVYNLLCYYLDCSQTKNLFAKCGSILESDSGDGDFTKSNRISVDRAFESVKEVWCATRPRSLGGANKGPIGSVEAEKEV